MRQLVAAKVLNDLRPAFLHRTERQLARAGNPAAFSESHRSDPRLGDDPKECSNLAHAANHVATVTEPKSLLERVTHVSDADFEAEGARDESFAPSPT